MGRRAIFCGRVRAARSVEDVVADPLDLAEDPGVDGPHDRRRLPAAVVGHVDAARRAPSRYRSERPVDLQPHQLLGTPA